VKEMVSHPAAKDAPVSSDTLMDVAEQLTASIASIKVYAVKGIEKGTHE